MKVKDYIQRIETIIEDIIISDVEDMITVKEEIDFILSMMYQDCEELSDEENERLEQIVC